MKESNRYLVKDLAIITSDDLVSINFEVIKE